MVVPDSAMIAEIILFAEGFNNTKVSFMELKIFLFKKNPQFSLLIAFSVNKLVSFFWSYSLKICLALQLTVSCSNEKKNEKRT